MRVYVAVFSHKYGEDVAVYRTSESAEQWKASLANDYWFDAFGDKEKPDDKERITQMYWDHMRDYGEEHFHITVCEVLD